MLSQIWYRGPSRQILHEGYAKHGRIDQQAPIISASDIVIDAPIDHIWSLLVDLPAWPTMTSAIRDVKLESGLKVDAYFRFRLYQFPIRAQIAVLQPMRELSWTGVSLWFRSIDQHSVECLAQGGTRLSIAESFAGVLAVPLISRARLKMQHEQWLRAVKQAAEQE